MKKILTLILVLLLASSVYAKNNKPKKDLPPGLQKKYEKTGELPPGWQKKVTKGEVLTPDLYKAAKKYQVKPEDHQIKSKIGTEILKIEDKIIQIKSDTKEILEVFGVTN